MAKEKDKRVENFRDGALDFVTRHFSDMEDAFKSYVKDKNYDKAVNLYMKLADKVIPSLQTQSADAGAGNEVPLWKQKIDKAKKTIEAKS